MDSLITEDSCIIDSSFIYDYYWVSDSISSITSIASSSSSGISSSTSSLISDYFSLSISSSISSPILSSNFFFYGIFYLILTTLASFGISFSNILLILSTLNLSLDAS